MSEASEDSEMIIRRAVFGQEVEQFMNSSVGQYMQSRAKDLEASALRSLRACDPENAGLVRRHQSEAKLAEMVTQWLEDAVIDGLQALQILDDRE